MKTKWRLGKWLGQFLLHAPLLWRGLGWVLWLYYGTLRVRVVYEDPATRPEQHRAGPATLYACWHENLLLPTLKFRKCHLFVLLSKSKDGEQVAQLLDWFGWRLIRGSSSRDGSKAAVAILQQCRALALPDTDATPAPQAAAEVSPTKQRQRFQLAIPVDGPRGPRRQLKPGIVFLARQGPMAVSAVGFAYRWCYRFQSWDRFVFPLPFSPCQIFITRAQLIAHESTRETGCDWLQAEMQRAEVEAHQLLGVSYKAPEERALVATKSMKAPAQAA